MIESILYSDNVNNNSYSGNNNDNYECNVQSINGVSTNHKGSAFGTDSRFSLGPPGAGAYPVWVRSQL